MFTTSAQSYLECPSRRAISYRHIAYGPSQSIPLGDGNSFSRLFVEGNKKKAVEQKL